MSLEYYIEPRKKLLVWQCLYNGEWGTLWRVPYASKGNGPFRVWRYKTYAWFTAKAFGLPVRTVPVWEAHGWMGGDLEIKLI
jgi:hypothetical protein